MTTKLPLSQKDRDAIQARLAKAISTALASDAALRMDAVLYGRAGIQSLPDSELLELAEHWQID